ncbi:MAG: imidazole glycerol phosphate synthase subunit HisH [Halarsenatibacteraceae bacterium]
MIGIIDYGAGNIGNVERAFKYLNQKTCIIDSGNNINKDLSLLVLPGVGSFAAGMAGLERRKLVKPINEYIKSGKPFLGICLGLQLLFAESQESELAAGLGVFAEECLRFDSDKIRRVPQIGWNKIETMEDSEVFKNLPDPYFYFVHSYFVPVIAGLTVAKSDYGGQEFTAILNRDNIWGIQPHPEKSGRTGLKFLENLIGVIK